MFKFRWPWQAIPRDESCLTCAHFKPRTEAVIPLGEALFRCENARSRKFLRKILYGGDCTCKHHSANERIDPLDKNKGIVRGTVERTLRG